MNTTIEEILKIRKPRPDYPVIEEIVARFSPRHFLNEEININDINSIFEAARFAPSGWNYEPWYFYWSKNGERSFKKIIACLGKYNRYAQSASILVVGCFIKQFKGK